MSRHAQVTQLTVAVSDRNHTIWLFRHQHTLDDDALLVGAREIGLHVERVQRELADGTRR